MLPSTILIADACKRIVSMDISNMGFSCTVISEVSDKISQHVNIVVSGADGDGDKRDVDCVLGTRALSE